MITFEGRRTTERTRDMLVEARAISGLPLEITQGGYNPGGVGASGGTHDKDALDIRATTLTPAQRQAAVAALRRVGFVAWLRTPQQANWPYHIHAVPYGGDLSPEARAQVTQYLAGTNGLASKGKDDGPRTWVGMTWERYEQENGMSAADADRVIKQVNAVSAHLALNAAQNRRGLFQDLAKLIESLKDGQTEQLTTYMRQMDAANDAEVAKLQAAVDALPKGDDGDEQAS